MNNSKEKLACSRGLPGSIIFGNIRPHLKNTKKTQDKITSISARVLLNEEGIDRTRKSYSQMEEKYKKLNLLVKNRLSTKESQQSDVDIEMSKKRNGNNKYTSDREIIFNSSEQLPRHGRTIVDL